MPSTSRKSSAAPTPWREEEVLATDAAGADELEGETAEEAEELELEDLSDDEEAELPVKAPPPEEDDSEW